MCYNALAEIFESQGVKGLYKKAKAGEKMNCTGIESQYAATLKLEIKIDNEMKDINQSVSEILMMLEMKGLF